MSMSAVVVFGFSNCKTVWDLILRSSYDENITKKPDVQKFHEKCDFEKKIVRKT